MTHDQLRKNHFARLNAYVPSKEYAEYAKEIGAGAPQGELPSLIGDRWEIDEEIYMEFLEMLPPMGWRGGTFYMSEFSFGDITAKFTREGGRYFCEFARYPARGREPEVGEPEPQTFRAGQYVTFPSGLGGTFSARVAADNRDGTYALQVLNADFEEMKPNRVLGETISPMPDAEQRYWRNKELDRRDPRRAR